jgi:hypothetical protein
MKFKVTSHLMNDIERMYIKEELQKVTAERRRAPPPGGFVDLGDEISERKFRSHSLRNRMLVIAPASKDRREEWIVLPQLPSMVEHMDEVNRQ